MQTLRTKQPRSFHWGIPLREIQEGESISEKTLLVEEQRTALISGNVESVIYSLPTAQAIGINHFILNLRLAPEKSENFTLAEARRIAPLLLAQNYIRKVTIVFTMVKIETAPRIPGIHYNLDHFRNIVRSEIPWSLEWIPEDVVRVKRNLNPVHRAQVIAESQGINVNLFEPWVEIQISQEKRNSVVFDVSHTERPLWYWKALMKGLQDPIGLGFSSGTESGQKKAPRFPGLKIVNVINYLEMAIILKEAPLFVGTPGPIYALAEGLKTTRRLVELSETGDVFPVGPEGNSLPSDIFDARKTIAECLPEEQAKLFKLFTKRLRRNPFLQFLRSTYWLRMTVPRLVKGLLFSSPHAHKDSASSKPKFALLSHRQKRFANRRA